LNGLASDSSDGIYADSSRMYADDGGTYTNGDGM
jgi:hypothetical protein